MSVKFLHTADIHLGAPMTTFGELAAVRKRQLLDTFLRVCELAVENELDLFVCAGDLFDNPNPEAEAVETAHRGFSLLAAAGIPAFAVPGGHDGAGTYQNIFDRERFEGLAVLGTQELSAPYTLNLKNGEQVNLYAAAAIPGANVELERIKKRELHGYHIALLHASLLPEGRLADVPSRDIPITADQLAALEQDYIALGHYHNFQFVEQADRTLGCYPGTIEAKRFNEIGPRCVALVTITDVGINIEKREVGQARVEVHSMNTEDLPEPEDVIRQVKNLGGEGKIARVTLTGLRQNLLDAENIAEQAADAFALVQVVDETEVAQSTDLRAIAEQPTVRGLATAYLLEKLEAESDPRRRRVLTSALRIMLHQFDQNRQEHKG